MLTAIEIDSSGDEKRLLQHLQGRGTRPLLRAVEWWSAQADAVEAFGQDCVQVGGIEFLGVYTKSEAQEWELPEDVL